MRELLDKFEVSEEAKEVYRKEKQPRNACLNIPKFDFSGLEYMFKEIEIRHTHNNEEKTEEEKPEYEENQERDTQEEVTKDPTHKPMEDNQENERFYEIICPEKPQVASINTATTMTPLECIGFLFDELTYKSVHLPSDNEVDEEESEYQETQEKGDLIIESLQQETRDEFNDNSMESFSSIAFDAKKNEAQRLVENDEKFEHFMEQHNSSFVSPMPSTIVLASKSNYSGNRAKQKQKHEYQDKIEVIDKKFHQFHIPAVPEKVSKKDGTQVKQIMGPMHPREKIQYLVLGGENHILLKQKGRGTDIVDISSSTLHAQQIVPPPKNRLQQPQQSNLKTTQVLQEALQDIVGNNDIYEYLAKQPEILQNHQVKYSHTVPPSWQLRYLLTRRCHDSVQPLLANMRKKTSCPTTNKNTHCEDYVEVAVKQIMSINITLPVGDILVFMTGQDEIEATCYALAKHLQAKVFQRIFQSAQKWIVPTNTVDGILYVINFGYGKWKAYKPRMCMDALQALPTRRVAANQRARIARIEVKKLISGVVEACATVDTKKIHGDTTNRTDPGLDQRLENSPVAEDMQLKPIQLSVGSQKIALGRTVEKGLGTHYRLYTETAYQNDILDGYTVLLITNGKLTRIREMGVVIIFGYEKDGVG
eukprot:Gb_01426 [translate_table: standard]